MKNLKSFAKQWKTLSTLDLSKNYNNFRLVDQDDLPQLSKVVMEKDEILVMALKKPSQPRITLKDIMNELIKINHRLDLIEHRLDYIVKANHLIDLPCKK